MIELAFGRKGVELEMYNILVVDDEKWIRKSIVKKIDRHNKWISQIDEAEDGLDALNKLEENTYDILLTDVKMPIIDGLELARTVNKRFPNIHVVIISGYDEFKYVQQAIKIGVNDYLLKPVNEDELNGLMKKIIHDIRNDRSHGDIENTIYQLMMDDHNQEDRFYNIIRRQYDGEFLAFAILYLEEKLKYRKEDIKKLGNQENEILILNEKKNRIDLLIISSREENINFLLRMLKGYIDSLDIKYYMISHMLMKKDYTSISKAYTSLNDLLIYIKLGDSNTCICSPNIVNDYSIDHYLLERQRCIINQIKLCDKDKLIKELKATVSYITSHHDLAQKNIKQLIFDLIYETLQFTASLENADDELMDMGYTLISEIDQCIFIDTIFEKLEKYTCYIIEKMSKEEVLSTEENIKNIIKYLMDNYYKDISLQFIEKKFYINASYFSHMFKKITGENFSSYLMKIRLEAAKKLLMNSDMKVRDITDRVGYTDTKHFSKLFKKYEGLSPIQYRKKCANQEDVDSI